MLFQQRSGSSIQCAAVDPPGDRSASCLPAADRDRMHHRIRENEPMVRRFRPRHGRRPVVGAIVALLACLGSLIAVSVGPAAGQTLSYPLLTLLMLMRG